MKVLFTLFLFFVSFIFSCFASAESLYLYNEPVSSFIRWYSLKTGKSVILRSPDIRINIFAPHIYNDDVFFADVLAQYSYAVIPGRIYMVCEPAICP